MSKQESFPVLSIDREDINHAVGYNLGPELSDDQMREIASKFSEALGPEPWNILADVVESLYEDSRPGVITIEVESGMVTAVRGLPANYQYEIIDHDVQWRWTPKQKQRLTRFFPFPFCATVKPKESE